MPNKFLIKRLSQYAYSEHYNYVWQMQRCPLMYMRVRNRTLKFFDCQIVFKC
jgi:hypothetical protein